MERQEPGAGAPAASVTRRKQGGLLVGGRVEKAHFGALRLGWGSAIGVARWVRGWIREGRGRWGQSVRAAGSHGCRAGCERARARFTGQRLLRADDIGVGRRDIKDKKVEEGGRSEKL